MCILCALDGVERPAAKKVAKGLCMAHGRRLQRGSTNPAPIRPRWPDISGKVFGLLTAISRAGTIKGAGVWRCKCWCGAEKYVSLSHLTSGNTQSCGCLNRMTKAELLKAFATGGAFGARTRFERFINGSGMDT